MGRKTCPSAKVQLTQNSLLTEMKMVEEQLCQATTPHWVTIQMIPSTMPHWVMIRVIRGDGSTFDSTFCNGSLISLIDAQVVNAINSAVQ